MPATPMTMWIDNQNCIRRFEKFQRDGVDLRRPLMRFYLKWARRIREAWTQVRLVGGMFRGAVWAPMAPMRRRADGTEIPVWGGVPKVRGGGMVKGKLRKGRKTVRYQVGQILMQDTANMANDLTSQPMVLDKTRIAIGTLRKYAEAQQEMRPYCFWELPRDQNDLRDEIEAYYQQLCAEANK